MFSHMNPVYGFGNFIEASKGPGYINNDGQMYMEVTMQVNPNTLQGGNLPPPIPHCFTIQSGATNFVVVVGSFHLYINKEVFFLIATKCKPNF